MEMGEGERIYFMDEVVIGSHLRIWLGRTRYVAIVYRKDFFSWSALYRFIVW